MRILRADSYRSTPWKNGGGITQEILRSPAGGAVFDWRLSVARIDRPGPFSDFAGYRRTMVLLAGNGIRLTGGGAGDMLLRNCGDLVRFDGALAVNCELLDGPCSDLNLICSNGLGAVDGTVETPSRRPSLRAAPGGLLLLFCITGPVEIAAAEVQTLHSRDCALAHAVDGEVRVAPGRGAPPDALIFTARLPDRG